MKKIAFLSLFLLHIGASYASESTTLVLKDHRIDRLFEGSFRYLVDESGSLSIDEFLQKTKNQETKLKTGNFHFGYVEGALWLTYHVRNESNRSRRLYLHQISSSLRESDLYTIRQSGDIQVQQAGYARPAYERPYGDRAPLFSVDLNPRETVQLVLRMTAIQPLAASHYHLDESSLNSHLFNVTLFFGAYIGCLIAIMGYNLFLYLSLRNSFYLYYLVFGVALGLHTCFLAGVGDVFRWTQDLALSDYIIYIRPLVPFSALLFARAFLQSDQLIPRLDKFMIALTWAALIPLTAGVLGLGSLAGKITDIYNNVACSIAIVASIFCYKAGHKSAAYYLLAWFGLIVSVVIWTLSHRELVQANFLIMNLPYVGSAWEMVLMSLALAHRIKILEINRDQAEKKAAEGELMKRLIRILCHDIRNPLSVISWNIDLVQMRPDQFERKFKSMKRAAKNLEQIVDHVHKMIALKDGKLRIELQKVNLRSIFEESEFIFKAKLAEKDISIRWDIDDSASLDVLAEPASLGNDVINNLLSNAIKFSPEHSEIFIKVGIENGEVHLTIKDSGIGMPQEILDQLFDPNAQTSRPGTKKESGTGYGMPIVKSFIDAYGGTISVESIEQTSEDDPDAGTTFEITLKAA